MAKKNKNTSEFGENIEVIEGRSTLNAVNVDPEGFYEHIGSTRKEAYPVLECWPTAITLQSKEGVFMEPYWNFIPVLDLTGYKKIKLRSEFKDHR